MTPLPPLLLKDVISSNNTNNIPFYKYYQKRLKKEPVNPHLYLGCNGKNVISIYVDKSIESADATEMIEDGAYCIMTVLNGIPDAILFPDKIQILYINYTFFYGEKQASIKNQLQMFQNKPMPRVLSILVSNCYFGKLLDFVDNTTIYTGTTAANEAIN